jgi:hypothetical protein
LSRRDDLWSWLYCVVELAEGARVVAGMVGCEDSRQYECIAQVRVACTHVRVCLAALTRVPQVRCRGDKTSEMLMQMLRGVLRQQAGGPLPTTRIGQRWRR